MEDNNKSFDSQDQSLQQQNGMPGGVNLNPNEATYWEAQNSGQYQAPEQPYQQAQQNYNEATPQYKQPEEQNQSAQYNTQGSQPSPETPEQFYSYYQQQINAQTPTMSAQQQNVQSPYTPQYNQPYAQTDYTQNPYAQSPYTYQVGKPLKEPKKKSKGKLVAAIIVVVILLSGAATAFAFQDTLINTFNQLTKSPAEYYAYIEEKAIEKSIDEIKPYIKKANPNSAYDITTDVSLNRETIDSLMQDSMDVSLSEIESSLGMKIESFGANFFVATKDSIINETMSLRFNKVDLITLEFFADLAKQELFARIPELSDAYLSITADESMGIPEADLESLKVITTEKTLDLYERYAKIIARNLKDVEIEKNAELSLDTISIKSSKLTIDITDEDLFNIIKAILEEARRDEYILEIMDAFDVSKDEYEDIIDEALDEMEDFDDFSDESFQMVVYVDGKGNIVGREFSSEDYDGKLGYIILTDGNYKEYEVFIEDENGDEVFIIEGSQTTDKDGADGVASINIMDPTDYYFEDISIDLDYENARTEFKNNQYYRYGSYSLSSLDLMGLQITSDFSVDGNVQNNTTTIKMGASSLVTIDSEIEVTDDYDVTLPSKNAQIYDAEHESDYYLETIDIESYISKLSDQLGIDIMTLLENLGLYDSYYDEFYFY